MKLRKWHLPMTLVLLTTGFLLVTALRAAATSDNTPWRQKNESLVGMIQAQEDEIKKLEDTIDFKRTALDRHQKNVSSGKDELQALQDELEKSKTLSGLTEVEGSGIVIVLDDNRKKYEAGPAKNPALKPEDFLIHDKHILYIVNELRVGGAEAISVNDQRVISTTDIRCVGPMIMVNTTRLGPPYTIKAIGNPDNMTRILELPESEYNILKAAGYPVQSEKQTKVTIPPYKGIYQFTYAQPKEE